MKSISLSFLLAILINLTSCATNENKNDMNNKTEITTLGAGCFWCVEAVFQSLNGVQKVESGYSGGEIANPTYSEICTGRTGHAEVCQITFDPEIISFKALLKVFWQSHDPTTLNRQGADRGTQYRSAIFYHNDEQKRIAEAIKTELNREKAYPNPVVTEISKYSVFYIAENKHQDYYLQNEGAPYCRMVIQPKLDKLNKVFGDLIKK